MLRGEYLRHEDGNYASECTERMDVQEEEDGHGQVSKEADIHQKVRASLESIGDSVMEQGEQNVIGEESDTGILSSHVALRNCEKATQKVNFEI